MWTGRTAILCAWIAATLCYCCGATALARAQRREPETGSVSGRVTCADTNAPARLASVVLVPILDTSFLPGPNVKGQEPPHEPTTRVTRTDLEGRFTMARVPTGNYYVVAEKLGYLQPLALIQREQMNKPDSATAELMARFLTPVSVAANHGSDAEVRIYRGATLSGSVRYDDGTPAIQARIRLSRKDREGKWNDFAARRVDAGGVMTDDQGSFRLAGLPAGEYRFGTDLDLDQVYVDHLFSDTGGTSSSVLYSLPVYYSDAYRSRDAKVIKVGEGEDVPNLNLTIRVSEMHSITGSVLERSGQIVNAATVALVWKDDNSSLVTAEVGDDNTFRFDYVPDGEYTLRVSNARDVTRTEVPTCTGCVPPTRTEQKLLKRFGDAERPIVLHTDLQAITVTVPPAEADNRSATAR